MRKHTLYTVIAASMATIVATPLMGQSDTTKNTFNESVMVVGDYNPMLDGVTEKINVAPTVNDNVAEDLKPKFSYNITPRRMSSQTSTSGIKAAKVIGSSTRLYNNYLKFGLGHDGVSFADWNPMADLYYMSTVNNEYAYGARVYHNTNVTTFGKKDVLQPSADYYGRDRISLTDIDLFGKYVLNDKHLFRTSISYSHDHGRYYGFSDSTLDAVLGTARDDLEYKQYSFNYNFFNFGIGAQSLNTDVNKLGYMADFKMNDMWGNHNMNQFATEANVSVHYGFPMLQKYKGVAYLRGQWQSYNQRFNSFNGLDDYPLGYASLTTPDSSRNKRNILNINPYIDLLFNEFKIHAGLTAGFNAYDEAGFKTTLFPDIQLAKSFMDNAVSLQVGLGGGLVANDWNSIRMVNPYVSPDPATLATREYNIFAHLRYNYNRKLIFNVQANNRMLKNGMFFVADSNYTLGNMFTPYFIDVNVLDFGGDVTFENDEMITLIAGLNWYAYYGYDKTQMPPLHAPKITAHLDSRINYKDKWLFTLKTLFVGPVYSIAMVDSEGMYETYGKLRAHVGLSVEAEYIHSRALSFFVRVENMLCQRYFIWANYPSERLNAMIGLTYTIPTKKR